MYFNASQNFEIHAELQFMFLFESKNTLDKDTAHLIYMQHHIHPNPLIKINKYMYRAL